MRLAIDVDDLHRPISGIGRYIVGLLSGLRALERTEEVLLLHRHELEPPAGFETRQVPGSSETWWAQVALPRAAREAGAQSLLCPAVRAPVFHRLPVTLVVHDVIYAVRPAAHARFERAYMHAAMRLALPRCQAVIAVSRATARDLRERFGVDGEVIPNGVEPRFRPRRPAEARAELARRGLELPSRYVLFVGTIEPRKNVLVLLEAFATARARGLGSSLVLVGRPGWGVQVPAAPGVVGLGHVADNVLPFVYAAADAVVYPSAYEGFGFPVLEGMASGVPVVTTRAPGVEEVAGDACLLVEPGEAAELADALIRVAEDQDLRANLIRRGGERAARYTWKETAARTLVVCERAAQA